MAAIGVVAVAWIVMSAFLAHAGDRFSPVGQSSPVDVGRRPLASPAEVVDRVRPAPRRPDSAPAAVPAPGVAPPSEVQLHLTAVPGTAPAPVRLPVPVEPAGTLHPQPAAPDNLAVVETAAPAASAPCGDGSGPASLPAQASSSARAHHGQAAAAVSSAASSRGLDCPPPGRPDSPPGLAVAAAAGAPAPGPPSD